MKNSFRRFIGFVIIFICCITCGYSFASSINPTAEYTLILYLNGCDLEGKYKEATQALEVLMDSSFSDEKINIIVVTGGTKKWHLSNPKISNTQCQAWRIYGSNREMENLKNPSTSSMMDKETLAAYVKWGIEEYPAKKYVLIMWSHGGGPIGGFGSDELNKNKSLSITDIQEALKKSLGGKKLELLIFGCCLMGNIEIAYKFKDYAKYMVGSEEIERGGTDKVFIEGLSAKPFMSGAELGKLYIDSHFKDREKGRIYTYSLIDLAKVEQIKQNWETFIKEELTGKLKDRHNTAGYYAYRFLAIARAYAESYDAFSRDSNGLVDMYDLAMSVELICKINTETLRQSIKEAVLYNKTVERPNSNGLSIFFIDRKLEPALGLEDNLQNYYLSSFSKVYYDFMTAYYDRVFVQDPTGLIGNITLTAKNITDVNPNADIPKYLIKIDQADATLINQIFFVIGKLEGNEKKFKALSIDKDVSFDENGISVAVTGKQYCIKETPVAIYWEGDIIRRKKPGEPSLGFFAVKYEDEIRFLAVKELVDTKDATKNIAQIIGMWSSKDYNGNVIPLLSWLGEPPKKGDKVTLLYKVSGKYVDGPEVTLDSYDITKTNLENGEYVGAFYIEDVIGRVMWSDYKTFSIDDSLVVKSSTAENSEAPMPAEETL